MNRRLIATLALLLAIILIVVGVVYATHTAQHLPTWFPGYDATLTKIHTKHSLAAFLLAAASFVLAWFQLGPKKSSVAPTPPTM